MTAFDARDYWPHPAQGRVRTNRFTTGDHEIVHTYNGDTRGNICLRQTIKGVFDSDWYYRSDPTRGVLEYRDDYPKKWYNYLEVWKSKREAWCVPGKEIIWGAAETIGKTIAAQCVTSGLFGQWGWQHVNFDEMLPSYSTAGGTFHSVLLLTYWQQWAGGKIDGAKMWLAPGLGQIRAEWMLNHVRTGYWMELLETKEGAK
jgi:hypothetical protein